MSWQSELDDLAHRRRLAAELGGADKVARHRAAGKLTVRERIAGLVDDGSFEEIGSVAGLPGVDGGGPLAALTPANGVCRRARIEGRNRVVPGDGVPVGGPGQRRRLADQ